MPGSEGKRELGGLARSIDALFSEQRPAPAPPESEDVVPAEESEAESQGVEAGGASAVVAEPDVVADALPEIDLAAEAEPAAGMDLPPDGDALTGPETVAEPLAPADVGAPVDLEPAEPEPPRLPVTSEPPPLPAVSEPPPLPTAAEPPPLPAETDPDLLSSFDDLELVPELEPDRGATAAAHEPPVPEPDTSDEPSSAPSRPAAEGPAGDELAEAVDAFLAGREGAAAEVESVAARLRERLALDPLADAVDHLVKAAGEPPDPSMVEMARSIMNPAVASRLVQRMGRERDEERLAWYTRLCEQLGVIMANAFRGALTDSTDEHARRVFYDTLIAMGDTSRPVIEEMVEDENRFLALNAVAILGEIGGPRAVELVTSALANTDPRVRREALLSLGTLGDEEAGQLVLASLEDPDSNIRLAAAIASGQLRLERALRPMLGMLAEEDDPEHCISLLQALGRIGDPGAVQAIEKHAVGGIFSKPRTDVRVAAYRALHAIGTPHARQLLEQARTDKDRGVQIVVRDLLKDD